PRRLFEGLDIKSIGSGRFAFARELLLAAVPFAERLETAAYVIGDKQMAAAVRHLAEIAADVFLKVEAKPESANAVRRFLSYYLPRFAWR
ncbi:5-bromo-4-chloroindolyl phosphate hydrolysis family protein, partial [Rhizobium ruizarguesonis]